MQYNELTNRFIFQSPPWHNVEMLKKKSDCVTGITANWCDCKTGVTAEQVSRPNRCHDRTGVTVGHGVTVRSLSMGGATSRFSRNLNFAIYTRFVTKILVGPSLEKFLAASMPVSMKINEIRYSRSIYCNFSIFHTFTTFDTWTQVPQNKYKSWINSIACTVRWTWNEDDTLSQLLFTCPLHFYSNAKT